MDSVCNSSISINELWLSFSSFSRRRKLCTIAMTVFCFIVAPLVGLRFPGAPVHQTDASSVDVFLQEVNSCNKNPYVFSSQNDQKLIPAQGELKYPAGNLNGYFILRVVRRNGDKIESSLRLSIHKLDWGMYYTHVTKFLLIIARKIEISHWKKISQSSNFLLTSVYLCFSRSVHCITNSNILFFMSNVVVQVVFSSKFLNDCTVAMNVWPSYQYKKAKPSLVSE